MTEQTHICIQQIPINDIKNSLKNIEAAQHDISKRQQQVLEMLLGKDLNGGLVTQTRLNFQSILRLWWIVGVIAVAIIGGSIKIWFL